MPSDRPEGSNSLIDTHVHFWDPRMLRYAWLDNIPALNRPFLVDDFRRATASLPLQGWVFVQAECSPEQGLAELDWVLSLAKQDDGFLGLVPWAPLHDGAGSLTYLEKLKATSPLVKGVRRLIQPEADITFCLQPAFIAGVQALARYDLSFDICISHTQLFSVIEMVRRCPEVQFILDHIAKPDIKNRLADPWRSELKRLAELPNVVCKLSGMVTEADHQHWTGDDLKPYIDHVISCFGFERIMFGGDWPVATLATTYPRWVDTLQGAVEECSEAERQQLFHSNAVRMYRLNTDTDTRGEHHEATR